MQLVLQARAQFLGLARLAPHKAFFQPQFVMSHHNLPRQAEGDSEQMAPVKTSSRCGSIAARHPRALADRTKVRRTPVQALVCSERASWSEVLRTRTYQRGAGKKGMG